MEIIVNELCIYLRNILGITVKPEVWEKSLELQQYLKMQYLLYSIKIYNTSIVLAFDRDPELQTPEKIEKQLQQISMNNEMKVVYVCNTITGYDRKRLIERKLSFIVPRKQMFLPFLGIDLKELFNKKIHQIEKWSFPTQYLLIYLLTHNEIDEINPTKAAAVTGYTKMTMSRTFSELQIAEVGKHFIRGKERFIQIGEDKGAVWETAIPYLRTPVSKKIIAKNPQNEIFFEKCKVAGESALAHYTMINAPKTPVYAIHKNDLGKRGAHSINAIPYPESDSIELELWNYPLILNDPNQAVDRYSLYLSLIENVDDRIQQELKTLMGGTFG